MKQGYKGYKVTNPPPLAIESIAIVDHRAHVRFVTGEVVVVAPAVVLSQS